MAPVDSNFRPPSDSSQSSSPEFLLTKFDAYASDFETCPYASSLIAWSAYHEAYVLIALTCKRWGCRYCGERRASLLASKVAEAKPNRLITLTINPKFHETPLSAYKSTTRKVSELSKKVRKLHGSFEYLRVLEVTKKGWPHYHLVCRSKYIPQYLLSEIWASLTGAPIVDVRMIRKHQSVYRYVLKYLCKQKYIPWTDRRVSWSRGFFPVTPETIKGKWKLTTKHWSDLSPETIIREFYLGATCKKIAADSWAFVFDKPPRKWHPPDRDS